MNAEMYPAHVCPFGHNGVQKPVYKKTVVSVFANTFYV